MQIESLRKFCLSLAGTTEQIQWGSNLLFKVGGKMYAVVALEPHNVWLSLKADEERFAELTERAGIIPAPYLARAKWIALETPETVRDEELKELVRTSYALVYAKLPGKTRASLEAQNEKRSKRISRVLVVPWSSAAT